MCIRDSCNTVYISLTACRAVERNVSDDDVFRRVKCCLLYTSEIKSSALPNRVSVLYVISLIIGITSAPFSVKSRICATVFFSVQNEPVTANPTVRFSNFTVKHLLKKKIANSFLYYFSCVLRSEFARQRACKNIFNLIFAAEINVRAVRIRCKVNDNAPFF